MRAHYISTLYMYSHICNINADQCMLTTCWPDTNTHLPLLMPISQRLRTGTGGRGRCCRPHPLFLLLQPPPEAAATLMACTVGPGDSRAGRNPWQKSSLPSGTSWPSEPAVLHLVLLTGACLERRGEGEGRLATQAGLRACGPPAGLTCSRPEAWAICVGTPTEQASRRVKRRRWRPGRPGF